MLDRLAVPIESWRSGGRGFCELQDSNHLTRELLGLSVVCSLAGSLFLCVKGPVSGTEEANLGDSSPQLTLSDRSSCLSRP